MGHEGPHPAMKKGTHSSREYATQWRRKRGVQPRKVRGPASCHPGKSHYAKGLCEVCYNRQRALLTGSSTESVRKLRLAKIGMTLPDYDRVLSLQGGVCAICHEVSPDGRRLSADHNHGTGDSRGLLCVRCNTAIGSLRDDPLLCEAAARYLREWVR